MENKSQNITFVQAINEALDTALAIDKHVICFGLGINDPHRIFATTCGLREKHGKERVFDMPTSENGMTGIGIGASLNGIRPVMMHQRLDFFLLAMDQLVNNAAKWYYMFGSKCPIPITIRLMIGRGWGQGPTHSQSLQAWFSHIPGLKVVMPTTAADAKGLLLSSIFDDNPVIFLEHRWLHNQQGSVPEGDYRLPLGQAYKLREGNDITIVSMSYMTIEALQADGFLREKKVHCDLIDLRTIKPIDWNIIFNSVKKTGRLLVLDTGSRMCSIASEIIAQVSQKHFSYLKQPPRALTMPDCQEPTSVALTKNFYVHADDIIHEVQCMLKCKSNDTEILTKRNKQHDVPGKWFRGPF